DLGQDGQAVARRDARAYAVGDHGGPRDRVHRQSRPLMGALAVIAAIGLAVFLLRPSAPRETVVVLPSADGHTGTVVVQRGEARQVLNQPYAVGRSDEAQVMQLSEAEVK